MSGQIGFSVIEDAAACPADPLHSNMQRFLEWMRAHGALIPSASIDATDGRRQVYTRQSLVAGEMIAYIPPHLTITPEAARASETGKLISAHGGIMNDNDYLAAYLCELKRKGGFWKPYIDILPADYSEHPLFFSEHELEALRGSYIRGPILSRRARLASRYEKLPPGLMEKGLTWEEFTWAACVVSTRVHGVPSSGRSILAMVPLSDMFNHSLNNNADWTMSPDGGYFILAESAVAAGAPLFENYGRRCNALLLRDYGFCLEDNPHNVAEIRLEPVAAGHPFFQQANQLGKKQWNKQVFQVTADYDDDAVKSMLSYLRLACFDESPQLLDRFAEWTALPPVSRRNEIAVLNALASACESRLQQFGTSVEEDDALLADAGLDRKLRNIVMVRRHEKVILKYFLELARVALPRLMDPACDVGRYAVDGERYAAYFADLARSPAGRTGGHNTRFYL